MPGMFPDYPVPVVATLATSARDPVGEFLEVRLRQQCPGALAKIVLRF